MMNDERFSSVPDGEALSAMEAAPLDLLVIGGGIVGAGIARDGVMRGLRVGLVEQGDFASGTSSRSSRLLHGGLRYLAQGRIKMVRDASREKKIISRIAPHLAEPLAFIFPTFKGGAWPAWKLRIGVKLYDLLCGGRNMGPSSATDAAGVRQWLPGLTTRGLTGAVRYFDGLTSDARLVFDTLRSAGRHGALLANYTTFRGASPAGDAWQCQLFYADQERTVEARCIVNAAGPWADRLPSSRVKLRRTKGVHLVIPRSRLGIPDAVVMAEGRRILFAIPWGRRVILGTTDTDYEGELDQVRTEPADIDYILAVTNRTFPEARLTRADVKGHWAGLRPLVADPSGLPSDISRNHEIRSPEPRWIDVAGGKLTTYRLIAEQTLEVVGRQLGRRLPESGTATEPLVSRAEAAGVSGVLPPPVTREAVEHYCRNEWARHLDDVMVRRTSWAYWVDEPDQVAHDVGGWMAEMLGWDAATREEELARYRSLPMHP